MQLRTEIEIDAPPKIVWQILVDGSSYHEWNPFITTLTGELVEDSVINIVVSPPDVSDLRFRPRVLVAKPEKELRWRGNMFADVFFVGEHYIQLTDLGGNRTRVRHGEDFKGFFLKFLGRQMTATARGFVFMNQALKKRAEAMKNDQSASTVHDAS